MITMLALMGLTNTANAADDEVERNKARLRGLEYRVAQLEKQLNPDDAEVEELAEEAADLAEDIDECGEACEGLNARIDVVNDRLDLMDTRITTVERDIQLDDSRYFRFGVGTGLATSFRPYNTMPTESGDALYGVVRYPTALPGAALSISGCYEGFRVGACMDAAALRTMHSGVGGMGSVGILAKPLPNIGFGPAIGFHADQLGTRNGIVGVSHKTYGWNADLVLRATANLGDTAWVGLKVRGGLAKNNDSLVGGEQVGFGPTLGIALELGFLAEGRGYRPPEPLIDDGLADDEQIEEVEEEMVEEPQSTNDEPEAESDEDTTEDASEEPEGDEAE